MSFAHDGLHDDLTRLAAPPHYYEILRREIALANRNSTELAKEADGWDPTEVSHGSQKKLS